MYTASDKLLANAYAKLKDGQGKAQVMDLFVNVSNPYVASKLEKQQMRNADQAFVDQVTQKMKGADHDGVVLKLADGILDRVMTGSSPNHAALDHKPVIRPLCLRAKAVLIQEGRAKPSDDSGNRPSFAVSPQ